MTRYTPQELAELLDQHVPTPEQQAMITAPHSPVVVVAGAGSGKTETMAARVVFAVANGLIAPDAVLGLTFTRKATSELAERLRRRLAALDARGVIPARPDGEPLGAPTTSTYHSYAHGLVAEHGLRCGVEPGAALVGVAAAVSIADEVAQHWAGDLSATEMTRAQAAVAIVDLAAECAEHMVRPECVAEHAQRVLSHWVNLPATANKPGKGFTVPKSGAPAAAYAALRDRQIVGPMVEAFSARKRALGVLDHGDLVAFAARLATEHPAVAQAERDRYALMLLDEFQDTSYAQFVLLRALFGQFEGREATSVTAVGDPHQSIYSWRGASAANLAQFEREFAGAGGEVHRVSLTTSWRNDRAVLAAANRVAGPLTAQSPIAVSELTPRPGSGEGHVDVTWHTSVAEECATLAEWIAARWRRGQSSAAVLCRTRTLFAPVVAALTERGLPVTAVGSGGLLTQPEVADVVATLRIITDPADGPAMARLLTTSRFGVAAQDVDALAKAAFDRDQPIAEVLDQRVTDATGFTDEGRERLLQLRATLRALRGLVGLAVPDVVSETIRALGVDVEVASVPGADPVWAGAHLAEFTGHAETFAATTPSPTLSGFVRWLDLAARHERGLDAADDSPETADVTDDAVTVCTVHAAKGLEWDVVAVPDMAHLRFPTRQKKTIPGATSRAALPHELRGDVVDLPGWAWQSATTLKEMVASLKDFKEADAEHHEACERRLAYVAVTRARSALRVSGAAWSGGKKPRDPGVFLSELRQGLDGVDGCTVTGFDVDPLDVQPEEAVREVPWPGPPSVLAQARRDAVARARAAAERPEGAADAQDPWAEAMALVTAEIVERRASEVVPLPTHVSASHLVRLAGDREEFAASLRRPVPVEPRAEAHRGTAFHAWVEQHFAGVPMISVDELPGATDEGADPCADEVADAAREHFLASPWASRTPVAVEVPVEFALGGVVVRGRVDAVFCDDDGYVLVDWKTGRPPSGERKKAVAVQLAAYAYAWRRLRDVPATRVRAAFFYAATGETVWVNPVDDATLESLTT